MFFNSELVHMLSSEIMAVYDLGGKHSTLKITQLKLHSFFLIQPMGYILNYLGIFLL
jgi:hypothetical protein